MNDVVTANYVTFRFFFFYEVSSRHKWNYDNGKNNRRHTLNDNSKVCTAFTSLLTVPIIFSYAHKLAISQTEIKKT